MKNTFKTDVELIYDQDTRKVVISYVKSTISKLCKFYIIKPYLEIDKNIFNIKIIAKVRPNIVFYNNLNKPKQELLDNIGNIDNKFFIGIKSTNNDKDELITLNCLQRFLRTGLLRSNFRTEVNNNIIIGIIYLETSNLITNSAGYIESEEDPFTPILRSRNSIYEGHYDDYVQRQLKVAREYESKIINGVDVKISNYLRLVYDTKDKQNCSYPRLLLERKLNRKLLDTEHCDHIDGNPLNNDIENLRPLLGIENMRIAAKSKREPFTEEHHANMKKAKIGYRPPEASIRKMREARINMVYTDEIRAKMSKSISANRMQKMRNDEVTSGRGKLKLSQVNYYRKLYEEKKITKRQIINETGLNESSVSRFLTYVTFNV